MNTNLWDERDIELDLRNDLATVIARIVSGVNAAVPNGDDYDLADEFRRRIAEHTEV